MLAITGGKGGTGKTTTTLGLARAFSEPTLAVDADWDLPDLHALAGVRREWEHGDAEPEHRAARAVQSSTTTETNSRHPERGSPVSPTEPSVAVLPAPPDPRDHDREAVLRRCGLADRPVLVDCPAGAGPDAVAPLRIADAALLVTTPCLPAFRDAEKVAAMAEAVDTPVVAVVVNRTNTAPEPLASALDCETAVSVPCGDSPVLSDERVQRAFAEIAPRLREYCRPPSETATAESVASEQ
jgi:septum site-determining protein MinD